MPPPAAATRAANGATTGGAATEAAHKRVAASTRALPIPALNGLVVDVLLLKDDDAGGRVEEGVGAESAAAEDIDAVAIDKAVDREDTGSVESTAHRVVNGISPVALTACVPMKSAVWMLFAVLPVVEECGEKSLKG